MDKNTISENWWDRNKNKVCVIGGVVVCTAVGVGLFLLRKKGISLNEQQIKDTINKFTPENVVINTEPILPKAENTKKILNNGQSFSVSQHIRNLGENRYPSPQKILEALENNIILGEHQTIVDPYLKNAA